MTKEQPLLFKEVLFEGTVKKRFYVGMTFNGKSDF
jgi:hypothetical protein